MGQAQPEKHICIFELGRKGDYFTDNVICRICGVDLSTLGPAYTKERAVLRLDKEKGSDS